jgi:hypothetical protein
MVEMWRGVSNGVLYNIQFASSLDDELVDRGARSLLTEPLFHLTPEEEYDALVRALESDETLTDFIPVRHGEREYRDFLRRLVARLDALRPWPELPYRVLHISAWERFGSARPVARIRMGYVKVQERLHGIFEQVPDNRRHVVLLALKDGPEVALVAPWWPDSRDVALLCREPDLSPAAVVGAFCEATGIEPEKVTPLV